ncbi:MAG: hypothetical protein KatS3mg096_468 [Candidatus Parcubacteria bacterium]|nr:MAG: hypothetical protein KatS3mg096_468 [Candidatus Parcubacteria bacterium]
MQINKEIKIVLLNIDKKFKFLQTSSKKNFLVILPIKKILYYFNKKEKEILRKFLKLKPKNKLTYFGDVRKNFKFVVLKNEIYYRDGKKIKLYSQYLPFHVYKAFNSMRKTMQKEIKKTIVLESGYRSIGYQLLILIQELINNKFNLEKTLKKIALPGFSEHNDYFKTAIDIITQNGIPLNEKESKIFLKTDEYLWLVKNANKFGFYQSFPKNNKYYIFEPWHWRYLGNGNN